MNEAKFFMWAIRRSGSHAVREWLMRQFEPPRKTLINCKYPQLVRSLERGHAVPSQNCLAVSFESHSLKTVRGVAAHDNFDAVTGRYDNMRNVIVLRDPWNLFASRRKVGRRLRLPNDWGWVEYAKAFVDRPFDAEFVLYNEWVVSEAYRKQLSQRIGGKWDDSQFDRVPRYGGGSSFDGREYDGRASEMNVFDRWREYWDKQDFRALFTNEVTDLAMRLFGTRQPEGLKCSTVI